MKQSVIVDTGPLVALLNRRDRHHDWTKTLWGEIEAPVLTCEAVVAEACHLLRKMEGGSSAVVELIRRGAVSLTFSLSSESTAVSRLLRRYGNLPMSLADACLVRMSELDGRSEIMTIDADFRIYRRHGRHVIRTLMPGRV